MIKNEQELFKFLQQNHFPDLKIYDDQFCGTDCYSTQSNVEIELKSRNCHYDRMMIEEMKYRSVMCRAVKTGRVPWYICSSPRGVWGWNLFTVAFKWVEQDNLPRTTEFDNCERIVKKVGFLPVYRGKKLGGK